MITVSREATPLKPTLRLDPSVKINGVSALSVKSEQIEFSNPSKRQLRPDQFEIFQDEDIIGQGNSGVVCRAKIKGISTIVAAKILGRNTPRKEFEREITNWSSLNHKYIHRCLGYCLNLPPTRETVVFSEYWPNGNVCDYMRERESPLTDEERIVMILKIAQGLEYLHDDIDMLHGDIKGNNILVNSFGEPLITDFGTARLSLSTITQTMLVPLQQKGTRMWQAPERLRGKRLTKEMDVYAYGMTCFEIFSDGELPFDPVPDDVFWRWIIEDEKRPEKLSSINESIALNSGWTILEECWAKEPSNRPAFRDLVPRLLSILQKQVAEGRSPIDISHFLEEIKPSSIRWVSVRLDAPAIIMYLDAELNDLQLDLDDYIGNVDGKFNFEDHRFSMTSRNIKLKESGWIEAELQRENGDWQKDRFNLRKLLYIKNGKLSLDISRKAAFYPSSWGSFKLISPSTIIYNSEKQEIPIPINLDEYIGNDDGSFFLPGGGFSASARNVKINGSGWLEAELCAKDRRTWKRNSLDLKEILVVKDGKVSLILPIEKHVDPNL